MAIRTVKVLHYWTGLDWAGFNVPPNNYYIHLTAFFQDNPGKPAPEKQNYSGKTNLDLLQQQNWQWINALT